MKLLPLILLFCLTACGDSPLFNHDIEGRRGELNTVLSESDVKKFQKTDYEFIISWQEGPQLGRSEFLIKTWDKNTGSLNGPYQDLPKSLNVYLWMPSMGHGSAPVKITKISNGAYEISDVHFIMGGSWEIRFQLKDGAQVFDETTIVLSI